MPPATVALIVHREVMNTDTDLAYIGAAAQLAGLHRFYTRRVLQRLNRGELSPREAGELLLAAAERGDARLEFIIDVEKATTQSGA